LEYTLAQTITFARARVFFTKYSFVEIIFMEILNCKLQSFVFGPISFQFLSYQG